MWTPVLRTSGVLLLCIGCTPAQEARPPQPIPTQSPSPSPVHEADPELHPKDGTAPRPFTAKQIHDAMPIGHRIRLRIQQEGKPTLIEQWTVTDANDQTCTIASEIRAPDGKLIEDQGKGTSAWTELREHAAFPAESTQVRMTEVEVPAGKFVGVLYEVKRKNKQGAEQLVRFYFASELPGPPVLMITQEGGREVGRMELLWRGDSHLMP